MVTCRPARWNLGSWKVDSEDGLQTRRARRRGILESTAFPLSASGLGSPSSTRDSAAVRTRRVESTATQRLHVHPPVPGEGGGVRSGRACTHLPCAHFGRTLGSRWGTQDFSRLPQQRPAGVHLTPSKGHYFPLPPGRTPLSTPGHPSSLWPLGTARPRHPRRPRPRPPRAARGSAPT